jgi:hypothetical protein
VSEAQGHLEYFQASFVVVPTGTGRSRGSWVWKYFSYHAAKDVSQCQVKIKDDDRKRIAKKFSSISETTSRQAFARERSQADTINGQREEEVQWYVMTNCKDKLQSK